ncbi:hypothetical protein G6F57_014696 [Rhizopus arrhizus]|nr:hypothetical protein G6F30_012751 [Rhizopus arrhizus]KAG0976126.1 hypothetical protein G6F28_012745 [Rhizopus arrhizus]KAG1001554.1 hypothetical protein G6F27_012765 [Rhizopus arrhizus]KAG1016172.1 hypothetical protein G6F26_012730 [Rhizopus arrhizus]KAG1025401.1 hypothetical protein G6F25_012810 [Rhizopus arrhizus]
MKLASSNQYYVQPPPPIPMETVEEAITTITNNTLGEEEVFIEEEKTILGEGDVGTQPTNKDNILTLTNNLNNCINQEERPTRVSNCRELVPYSPYTKTNHSENPTINTITHQELHYSKRRYHPGRETKQIHQLLETNDKTPLAIISNSRGLQNTICTETNSVAQSNNTNVTRRPITCRAFQDGGSPSFARNHRTRRLYVQNRSKRCIRRHTNTPRFNGLFNFHKSRHRVQVSLPGFWSKRISKSFQQNNALCHRTIKERRNKINILFGRYMRFIQDKGRDEQVDRENQNPFGKTRFYNKLYQEYTDTFQDSRIPRIYIQHQEDEDFSTTVKDQQYFEENQTSQKDDQYVLPVVSRFVGEDNVHNTSDWGSTASYQISTERSSMGITVNSSKLGNELQIIVYQHPRIRLDGGSAHRF